MDPLVFMWLHNLAKKMFKLTSYFPKAGAKHLLLLPAFSLAVVVAAAVAAVSIFVAESLNQRFPTKTLVTIQTSRYLHFVSQIYFYVILPKKITQFLIMVTFLG